MQDLETFISDDLRSKSNLKKSTNRLKELVTKFKNGFKNSDFKFETVIDYDTITNSTNSVVSTKNIDLIVMGTNGATGAKEVLFGSNTINVIRKVNCPTLVIPEGYTYTKPHKLLLPLDLHDSLSGKAFIDLIDFTDNLKNITLHILRIKPNNEDCKEERNDANHINYFLRDLKYKYNVIRNIPMQFVVDGYSQLQNIDITALLVQKESVLERFFIGSSTTKISNNIKVPLLILHRN